MALPDLRQATILVVDDEEPNLDLLEAILLEDGYEQVTGTRDSRQVLPLFEEIRPDLILLDLHMPHLDGFEVMRQLGERIGAHEYLPILVLTADVTREAQERALTDGAKDFLTKPFDPTEVQLRIRNLLETRFLHRAQREARERAEFLAEASRVLVASFDYHTTLANLAQLAVPRLSDFCMVNVAEGDTIRVVGLAHADAAKQPLLRKLMEHAAPLSPEHPVGIALTRGRSTLIEDLSPEMTRTVIADEQLHSIVDELGPRSLVAVPLPSANRPLGALLLALSDSGRRYRAEDMELAEELARRASLAVENARSFHQAQLATRRRDETLAVVAHDLRNPLNTIRMGASLLLEEAADARHRKHLEIVQRSADRMNRLIEDLLEVTRIESGRMTLDARLERVGPVLEEATAMLQPLAASKSIALVTDAEGGALSPVPMDSARILQVISNLVGNAVKFTPAGGRITLRAEAAPGEVRFSVVDTGPGIPAEQIPHVFGQFWQADRRDRRGVGLGLAIAQGIVEAHGGKIWVECPSAGGSVFRFTLPLDGSTTARTAADEVTGSRLP